MQLINGTLACLTAFVEDRCLFVDGKLLPFPDSFMLVLPKQASGKVFLVLGDSFVKENIPLISVELEKIEPSSISIISAEYGKVEFTWDAFKDSYFPYVVSVNSKNIFYISRGDGVSGVLGQLEKDFP